MKTKILAIGAMCALLVAFGAGFLILWEPPLPPEYEGPRELEYLFRYELPPIFIRLEGGEREPFTIVRLELDPQRNLTTDATIEGKEHLPLDAARISGVITASRHLAFLELVLEEADDYAIFGLDPPRGRATLDFGELGIRTLLIGDVAPGNIGVYVMLDGDPAIYLCPVYTVDNFLRPYLDYMNMNITPPAGRPLQFESMTLGGRARESAGEITVVADGADGFRLELPIRHELSPYLGPSVLHSVFGIQATGIAATNPSADDLEALGLDRPWASISVTGGEQGGFTLYATQPDAGGMVLLYRRGVPLLYMAMAMDLPWLEAQFYELMLPFAVSPLLEELAEIDVTVFDGRGAHVYRFEVLFCEQPTVFFTDSQLDTDNFRRFFTTLTSATLEYAQDRSYQPADPIMTFIYRHRSGREQRVSFYDSPIPLRHFIRVDDGILFLAPSSYVERVISDLARVTAGERVEAY